MSLHQKMEPKSLEALLGSSDFDRSDAWSAASTTFVNVGDVATPKKAVPCRKTTKTTTTVRAKLSWRLQANMTSGSKKKSHFLNLKSKQTQKLHNLRVRRANIESLSVSSKNNYKQLAEALRCGTSRQDPILLSNPASGLVPYLESLTIGLSRTVGYHF